MIKFFRHIRKQLLSENKTGKYFKYATGEIILVVIGILIALQINNWNELKKKKLVEVEILDGIRNDILLDTIDLNSNISSYKRMEKGDSLVLDHLINKKKMEKRLIQYLGASIHGDLVLNLHRSHFEEAKIYGLSIISNKSLRNRISRLYEFTYETLKVLENSTESFDYESFLSTEFNQYFGLDSSGLTLSNAAYERLISNGTSLYLYRIGIAKKAFLLDLYETTLGDALMIVDSIDVELKNLKK
jgi:hypothetical protein